MEYKYRVECIVKNEDGTVKCVEPKYEDVPKTVRKRIIKDLDKAPFPTKFEMPFIEAVHDRITLEVFRGTPYLHIGFDEEIAVAAKGHFHMTIRQGDLWWHDLRYIADCCKKRDARPIMFSDKMWWRRDEFLRRMDKDIVQSPWYYKTGFDRNPDSDKKASNWFWKNKLESVEKLGKAGFDLIPCGSNYYDPKSFEGLVEYGDRVVPREHLLGYLMAPWAFTLPGGTEQKNLEAIGQLGAARRQHAMRG